jgi:hypothetical protein
MRRRFARWRRKRVEVWVKYLYTARFCSSLGPLYVAPSPPDLLPSPAEHLLYCRISPEDLLLLIQLLQLDRG